MQKKAKASHSMLGRQYMMINSEKKNQEGAISALSRDMNKYQLAKRDEHDCSF